MLTLQKVITSLLTWRTSTLKPPSFLGRIALPMHRSEHLANAVPRPLSLLTGAHVLERNQR